MAGTQLSRRPAPDPPKLVGRKWEGDADRYVQSILEDLINKLLGLPVKHSFTHVGGDDDVAGTSDPITVRLSNVADPGTASLGMAPIDHVHELDPTGLAGGDIENIGTIDTLVVYDPENRRLLESILLALKSL